MEQTILIESYIEGLFLNENLEYLDETFKEFLAKLTPPRIKQMISKSPKKIESKNELQGIMNLGRKFGLDINKVKSKDMINAANSLPDEIKKGAKFSKKVIKNSIPKASESSVNAAAHFVAVLAKYKNYKSSNYMGSVKSELKSYIMKVQQFYEEAEEKASDAGKKILPEDMADMAIAIGTVVALSAITVILIAGVAVLVKWLIIFVLIAVGVSLLNWIFKPR